VDPCNSGDVDPWERRRTLQQQRWGPLGAAWQPAVAWPLGASPACSSGAVALQQLLGSPGPCVAAIWDGRKGRSVFFHGRNGIRS
jgi:hypothetical protein